MSQNLSENEKRDVLMDKRMRKEVTRPIRKAEKILKKAEHSNMKLADYDEKERDPIIDKYKKRYTVQEKLEVFQYSIVPTIIDS
jgi:hypothetical protein